MRDARRRLATLNWPETADDLGRGLRASQSRLRKSWRRARRDRTPGALHHWRKRVKDQSAQLRLLRSMAPQEAKSRREVQKQVAEFLGDEHDLHLFAERLSCAAIPPRVEPVRTISSRRSRSGARPCVGEPSKRLRKGLPRSQGRSLRTSAPPGRRRPKRRPAPYFSITLKTPSQSGAGGFAASETSRFA